VVDAIFCWVSLSSLKKKWSNGNNQQHCNRRFRCCGGWRDTRRLGSKPPSSETLWGTGENTLRVFSTVEEEDICMTSKRSFHQWNLPER
jgi:hypothetical protein